jgi:hypothetical protein
MLKLRCNKRSECVEKPRAKRMCAVKSNYQVTANENRKLCCSEITFDASNSLRLSYSFVVTVCTCSMYPIINPKPLLSHNHMTILIYICKIKAIFPHKNRKSFIKKEFTRVCI